MINKINDFMGKTTAVVGIGISNTPLIEFLLSHGAIVTARDKKSRSELMPLADELEKKGVRLILGSDYLKNFDEEIIFRSPGVRYDSGELPNAVSRGAYLTSEMETFFKYCPAKIIGVTGSDGKTTTTTLIYTMLKAAGKNVYVGGNIGKPLLPEVEKMTENDFAVVELSSFQLHNMRYSPDIAIVTNISPNHLDYHVNMDEYIEAKTSIFRHQKSCDTVILNYSNKVTREFANEAVGKVVFFMSPDKNGLYETAGRDIYYNKERIISKDEILLPGQHNVENFMAAIAAVRQFVSVSVIEETAKTFAGVEHRIEFVGEYNGVRYYNSSIDSSPTRTAAALHSFKQKLIVICGGYDKHISFKPLGEVLCECAKCVVLTGATAGKIKEAIINAPAYSETRPQIFTCVEFEAAVHCAENEAETGDTVILSPACASFDAFKNFEERGNTFKKIVRSQGEKN